MLAVHMWVLRTIWMVLQIRQNCLLVPCTAANNISCHSYCKARNRHCDYFITTTPPHSKATNSNYKYEFYSLVPCPSASGLFGHWPPFLMLLGQLCLPFLLLLTENKNIHTITIGHTHIENYTIIS